jgi:hypothetical protein
MQILQNGIEVPTNSDPYNLTEDLANMGNTTNTVVLVANQAARDGLTKYDGLAVRRLDLTGRPTETWDGAVWHRSPVVTSGSPVSDGFWAITGGLTKTVTDGPTQVTASFQMKRTGSAINILTTDSTLIIGAIPSGFRPAVNNAFITSVNDNIGNLYAQPQLIVNSGGSIVGRSTSGGGITIGTNYTVFISVSWYI